MFTSGFDIGGIRIDTPLVLAPMAGVTNHAFRLMCRELGGCGLVTSEMISSYALWYCHKATHDMLDWTDAERPVSAQVFGSVPHVVADAAKILEQSGADIIDINMGCPAPKVSKTGAGAALMKDLPKVQSVIEAVVKAVGIPVTVKTRRGWDQSSETAVDVARIAEDLGCAAIAVHGRTASQGYTGNADLDIIRRVKESVSIPVIGNGDVRTPQDARRMIDSTGCDGVMIGRGAMGNPWIFNRINAYLRDGVLLPEPDMPTRIDGALRHMRLLVGSIGELRAVREMRGHVAWYLKGVPGSVAARTSIMKSACQSEIEEILNEARSKCESGACSISV